MKFSLEEFIELVPSFPRNQKMVDWLNWVFDFYHIDNPLRVSAYLARIGVECNSFNTFEEIATGEAYENRRDLGNYNIGDGVKYKGRGAIQVTGKSNYNLLTKAFNRDFINKPEQLTDIEWAIKSSGFFWNYWNLNKLADLGDIKAITKKINGGYNGLDKTVIRYKRCLEWFNNKGF